MTIVQEFVDALRLGQFKNALGLAEKLKRVTPPAAPISDGLPIPEGGAGIKPIAPKDSPLPAQRSGEGAGG